MDKLLELKRNQLERPANEVKIIEQYSSFDEVMEKITDGMFKVILFGGIPYFLWIFIQFMIKF
ncbi:hypothetical protein [Bacillus sp. AK128]